MRLSNQDVAWIIVYLAFPLAPALVETVIKGSVGISVSTLADIPAYSTALVGIVASSVAIGDKLNSYVIPGSDTELEAGRVVHRWKLWAYTSLSAILFGLIVNASALDAVPQAKPHASAIHVWQFLSIMLTILFVRSGMSLQGQYKFTVPL